MKRKKYIIAGIIILLVILGRLMLPYFLKKYVNRALNDLPGYEGKVEDIDVALIRGAYVIDSLTLRKEKNEDLPPLLNFPKSDISIEWNALFRGRIVSEIVLHNPQLNFVMQDQAQEAEAEMEDWTEVLTDLVPININHLQVHNGTLNFIQPSGDSFIDLTLRGMELEATNLRNVRKVEAKLPSMIHATATSFGGGNFSLEGRANVIKKIPDMDIEFSIEQADVTALNKLTQQTAGVDFTRGTFELYSEFAIADGYLEGYLKPMFIDTELTGEQEDQGFFKNLWEGIVGVFKFLFKNQGTDTLATRAPLSGDLNDLDTGVITTILNIFKNAWIEAFKADVDEDINFNDAQSQN